MTNLKLSWIGAPIIDSSNTIIHMETRKATALLAYLGLSSTPLSREYLATLFWPEFDQTHSLANLRRTLFSITKSLGSEILSNNRENVGINPESIFWQDVSEFHWLMDTVKSHRHTENFLCPECMNNLEKALSLYRGDFLEGVNLRDCPEFDDWQYLQREGLRLDIASTLEKLGKTYLSLEQWDKAILITRQWVAMDRLNEPAQRLLIQIYAKAGQRNAASRQYDELTRLLQDELGQSPEEETIKLFRDIQTSKSGKRSETSKTGEYQNVVGLTNQPLIKTKLFIPRPRPGLVSRPYLFNKLEEGAQRSLTLISAPAGYGKTTLLSEWIESRQKDVDSSSWSISWFSLDPGDNDPIRFLTYLTAALQNVHPEIGAEAWPLLQSSQSLPPQTPLSILINDLQELSHSVSLVLDDYQFISNPIIHDGITFLLDHMPVNVHLVIVTRSDPPLPLALLRGRNQLNELRANDLRFTSNETTEFLQNSFDISLTPSQISTLENCTEGWIAGLQMAAISMKGRSDIVQFIEAFSGSHRFIMDYLTEEALNRQTNEIQVFLLTTSILERLNGSLCDAVLARKPDKQTNILPFSHHSPIIQNESQNILKELELSNLFIVPIDDDRIWFRYHHLFADILRSRLEQTSPELIPILHMRASAWFENNGWIEESFSHSLAAKDWRNASRLLNRHFHTYLENGQMTTVLKWIEGFPQEVIFSDPKLCAQVAEAFSQAGMIDQIDPYLNRAEEILLNRTDQSSENEISQPLDLPRKDINIILSMALILRGLKSVCSGDPNQAIILTDKALVEIPEMEPRELAVLFWVQGWAYRSLGNLSKALDVLTKATEYAIESGAILRDVWTDLANVTRLIGKLPQAIDILTNSLQIASDRGIQNQGNLSRDETFLSFIFLEKNQLDLAMAHANRAIAHTQWWPSHIIIAMVNASIAQILLAQGDLEGSISAIQKADHERKKRMMTPFVHSIIDVTLVHIWLIQGKWALLDQWTRDLTSKFYPKSKENVSIDEYLEMQLIMLARVWMDKTKIDKELNRNEECLDLLARLEESSTIAGRKNSLVEILFLQACIRFSQGETSEALEGLDRCLSIAEPGGYMRIFLDTGELGRALLILYSQNSKTIYKSYAMKILREFGSVTRTEIPQIMLPEAITSREMDVLQLLAEGCSNRQIAERLVLSEGTIKFHVHNLLEKLQADSRTHAIAIAKDLNLI